MPTSSRNPSDLLSNSRTEAFIQIQEAGFKKSASPLGLLSPWALLSSPYPILNPQVSFYGLKKIIFIYLAVLHLICTALETHPGLCLAWGWALSPPTFSTVCSCSPAGCLSCGRPHPLRGSVSAFATPSMCLSICMFTNKCLDEFLVSENPHQNQALSVFWFAEGVTVCSLGDWTLTQRQYPCLFCLLFPPLSSFSFTFVFCATMDRRDVNWCSNSSTSACLG